MNLFPKPFFRFRKRYLTIALVLFLVEVIIALFIHDNLIRPLGGDFLIVIFLYCLLRGTTNIGIVNAAGIVLGVACLMETLQFFHVVDRLQLQDNVIARTIIGTSFSWSDIKAYILGVTFVLFIEKMAMRFRRV